MGETVWFSLSAVEGDSVIEVFLVTVSVTLAPVAVSSASFCGELSLRHRFLDDCLSDSLHVSFCGLRCNDVLHALP